MLNLGQDGNGPLIELATLREYLKPNIKNVLWLYYERNDLYGLHFELKNEILNQYLANQNFKQDLKFKQTQIDQFLTTFLEREREREREKQAKFYTSKIVKFIKLSYVRTLLFPPDFSFYSSPSPYPYPYPELKVILNLANELVSSYNGKLYFIYLPQIERYLKPIKMDHKQQIKKIVVDLDIEFIDIDEDVFQREKNPLKLFPFEKYAHYNVEGYKKVALKIYERTK